MPGPIYVLLWDRLRNWLNKAKSLCSTKDAKEFRLDTLEEEIRMLEQELPQPHQEIRFCHNDLQYGNIMIDEETRAITIIDYEYASFNTVAYDLANHFCEMAANYHTDTPHILDYSIYPGLVERRRFVHVYLSSAGNQPSESEVDQLVHDAEKYTLANHLFWGLWGIISAYVNKIDFNYTEYARQRFQQYWSRRPSLLQFRNHSKWEQCKWSCSISEKQCALFILESLYINIRLLYFIKLQYGNFTKYLHV
ncbi:hypothetical protein Patl1_07979 [Pistacia atlantica]|uniref:Uncharacterized protein n=1 Tax=Pistacia atlantica TaxID=434234 RepID=A0ACC1AHD7_9ROSI|nr:hypothetical protein Patl1_07979 [Pistacia atlantica]